MFNALSTLFFSMGILHLMTNLQGGTVLSLAVAVPIALVLATLVFLIFQFKASGILFGLTYLALVLPNMNEGTSVINLILMNSGFLTLYVSNYAISFLKKEIFNISKSSFTVLETKKDMKFDFHTVDYFNQNNTLEKLNKFSSDVVIYESIYGQDIKPAFTLL